MKMIGMSKGGSVILEANISEARGLIALGEALAEIQKGIPPEVPPPARAEEPERRTTKSTKKQGHKTQRASRAERSRDKVCVVCKSAFRDNSKTNCRKTCGDLKCKKTLRKARSADLVEKPRRKYDSTRRLDKAKRLEILKTLNRREQDPLAEAAELHRKEQEG